MAQSVCVRLLERKAIYLSTEMQTSTKLDKYKPNTRANDIMRHIKSPACHDTVIDQPTSNGIITKVTSKSAIAKWVSIVSMRDGRFLRRFINITSTVMLPTDESTIKMLGSRKTTTKVKLRVVRSVHMILRVPVNYDR